MTVAETIVHQFVRFAPRSVSIEGRAYRMAGPPLRDGEHVVHMCYLARRRPGAPIRDKLNVEITYLPGPDLYRVVLTHCDGESLQCRELDRLDDVYADAFADVQLWLDMAAREAA